MNFKLAAGGGSNFPAGTTVKVYLRSQISQSQYPLSGEPKGAAVKAEAVVAADGSVEFAGLEEGQRYVAAAEVGGAWRFVRFTTASPGLNTPTGIKSYVDTATGLLVPKTAIDTSSALGGSAPSDEKVASQKALKAAIDRNRPGRSRQKPTVALCETIEREKCTQDSGAVVISGTLYQIGFLELVAGEKVSSLTVCSGSTGITTPENQWFALIDPLTLAVLAKTVDNTTAAWTANTLRTLEVTGGYTPTEDRTVGLCIMVKAATPPTLRGVQAANAVPGSSAPLISGRSTTGLTTPASLGATAAALSNNNGKFYGYAS